MRRVGDTQATAPSMVFAAKEVRRRGGATGSWAESGSIFLRDALLILHTEWIALEILDLLLARTQPHRPKH